MSAHVRVQATVIAVPRTLMIATRPSIFRNQANCVAIPVIVSNFIAAQKDAQYPAPVVIARTIAIRNLVTKTVNKPILRARAVRQIPTCMAHPLAVIPIQAAKAPLNKAVVPVKKAVNAELSRPMVPIATVPIILNGVSTVPMMPTSPRKPWTRITRP